MISADSKLVHNINNKIEVVKVDEFIKEIVKNEVMIGIEDAISIDNKEEMEIRTNIEECSKLKYQTKSCENYR